MSGNFDSPPSSDSPHETADRIVRGILDNSQASDADISPSGELYRAIERFHRNRLLGLQLDPEHPNFRTMDAEQDADRARRLQRSTAMDASPLFVLPPSQPSGSDQSSRDRTTGRLASMASRRGRSRMSNNERHLGRHRTLNEENSGDHDDSGSRSETRENNGLSGLQRAGRQLEAASSNLRALLDDPVPNIPSPTLDVAYSSDAEHGRRAKRRRLDTDRVDLSFPGFSYGRYGQVEPGKLKMEIVSCDGGIFQEHGGNYGAENVLKNDRTVYCTKSNRCNLVLRHQGATVFSLKELIIKAPHSGYTAPVQEGMVFVSMTSDDLLARTAQYQIQYSPPRHRRGSNAELPPILSIRHNIDGSMTTAQARVRRLYDIAVQDAECDRTAQIPSDFMTNAPPFQVTTECSDSEGEEQSAQPSRQHTLHRIMGIRFEDSESSDDEWHEEESLFAGVRHSPGPRRRETASNITLSEAAEASQVATQEAVKAVGGELMAPHARFFIERDKTKCTVKFDPPVSGRFILLKMWSPHHSASSNIDIQSVVAKGFAGPRYFPAITLR